MTALDGYFIGPDANDELYLWRERGDCPVPIVGARDFRDDPEVWDVLVAATKGPTCVGCGCQSEHDGDYGSSGHAGECPPHTCALATEPTP